MHLQRLLLIFIPVLISGFVLVSSCEKKVIELAPSHLDELPEKTFYAIVNGAAFVDTILWAEENAGKITITATMNGENQYPRMTLKFPSDIIPGTYEFGGPLSPNTALIDFGPLPSERYEAIDSTSVFVVTSHFEESNIMRGKFIYKAEPSSGPAGLPTIDIWSGNFVITY